MTSSPVTASMLYDLVACPHRVTMDLFGNPRERDKSSPFVQLLWEKGSAYESEVMTGLAMRFLDLSRYGTDEKEQLTTEAMQRGEPLIYGGRVRSEGLLGDPDLLRKEGGGYIAGDIKSGSAEQGPEDDTKPKLHYAVQLGLYTDILERKRLSAGRRAFVWDIRGQEVAYDFEKINGVREPRALWQDYLEVLREAEGIVSRTTTTLPAYSATCKLCHWYSACVKRLRETDDLTTIPDLGRSKRDVMHGYVRTVADFARTPIEKLLSGKKTLFSGIGPDSLRKFHDRARLLTDENARPFARAPIEFPKGERELFFDIEVDPMRDICYLHGFIERRGGDNATEAFFAAFASDASPKGEEDAFAQAWAYVQERRPCVIYYYSKYERTIYRKLQQKYPRVCSAADIEELFNPRTTIDLYSDVVKRLTEWPTWDYSIKTIAKFLGFSWRDSNPSGAASIEWFDRWIQTRDPAIRQRVLDYNEDDCRATRVLRDAIEKLPVREGKP